MRPGPFFLEFGGDGQAGVTRCAGGDVIVIMRVGKIGDVADVFDVDLRSDFIRQCDKERGIDPRVGG